MNPKNNVIAKFLGKEVLYGTHVHHETAPKGSVTVMKYDTDWNWLLEVIRIIELLDDLKQDKDFNRRIDKVLCLPIYTKQEIVYNAVIEFLEWYNENNRK